MANDWVNLSGQFINFYNLIEKFIKICSNFYYTQKNVWFNQPNFGWFNQRIWLLYGQPNFWLSEQNFLVNKIWLMIPIILVDPTKYYG